MTKIRVYRTRLQGSDSIIYASEGDVLQEVREILPELQPSDSFTITITEMEDTEYDALDEFRGY